MPIVKENKDIKYSLNIDGISQNELHLVTFTGHEGISELFYFEIDLASSNHNIDFSTVLGKEATLDISSTEFERQIHGFILRFEYKGLEQHLSRYRTVLVPIHYFLSMRHMCRIFQDKNIPDIILQVIQDAKMDRNILFKLTKDYDKKKFVVQYQESDLAFISRLMETEGIYYYFEHKNNTHKMVLNDSSVDQTIDIPTSNVPYQPESAPERPDEERIFSFMFSQEIKPGSIKMNDFNFTKPSMNLTSDSTEDTESKIGDTICKREVYNYPGGYDNKSYGDNLSKIRLEELRSHGKVGEGKSDCRELSPGYKFEMGGHERNDYNVNYLITRVSHTGGQRESINLLPTLKNSQTVVSYNNSFKCIPLSINFKPSQKTPKPKIKGSQTAIVTGTAGEEIYTDEYGRVKVKFPWDITSENNEKSSCWIRVSHSWAGASWGAIFTPRIGQEVIVSFINGDPDRPIISGRVYNGENPVPYNLPEEKTKSGIKTNSSLDGEGFNEIRFEDKKGSEEVFIHAQKDKLIITENNKNEETKNNETLSVGNDRSKTVTNDETVTIDHDRTENVANNETVTIGNDRSHTIEHDETASVGNNSSETIGKNSTISVGKDKVETIGEHSETTISKNRTEAIGVDYAQTVGSNSTMTIGKDSTIDIGKNSSIKIGESGDITIGKNQTIEVGKDLKISAKKISIEAGDSLEIKVGKAKIVMKKDGSIKIDGKNINLKGSGDIKLKGTKVTAN